MCGGSGGGGAGSGYDDGYDGFMSPSVNPAQTSSEAQNDSFGQTYGGYAFSGPGGAYQNVGPASADYGGYTGGYTGTRSTPKYGQDYMSNVPYVGQGEGSIAPGSEGLDGGYATPTEEANAAGKKNLTEGIKGLVSGGIIGGLKSYVESALAADLSPEAAAIVADEMGHIIGPDAPGAYANYSQTGFQPGAGTQRGRMTPVKDAEGSAGTATGPAGEAEELKRQREKSRQRRGFLSTMMTSPLGLVERPSVERKSLFALG